MNLKTEKEKFFRCFGCSCSCGFVMNLVEVVIVISFFDVLGALMVLTLKVISCAINYNDGMLKEEGLREAQKKNRLIRMPSLIEYFGYCLCCGSHFAGPVYEMKDYLEWTQGKGVSKLLLLEYSLFLSRNTRNLYRLVCKFVNFVVSRFGIRPRKESSRRLMELQSELFCKLRFAWLCICI